MAAICSPECPSCGEHHQLIVTSGDFFNPARRYEYTCPKSGKAVVIRGPEGWHKIIGHRPAGAIEVSEHA
jgi:predicted RNA-binding Zn-ribbon protein involved in translation (DUF1610 family)